MKKLKIRKFTCEIKLSFASEIQPAVQVLGENKKNELFENLLAKKEVFTKKY